VNLIRAVARYMVVLAFPIATRRVLVWTCRPGAARVGAGGRPHAPRLMTFDLASFWKYGFSSAESQKRIECSGAAAPRSPQPVVSAMIPPEFWVLQATTRCAGQAAGRTLNGYLKLPARRAAHEQHLPGLRDAGNPQPSSHGFRPRPNSTSSRPA
jgi:hypothetical protein